MHILHGDFTHALDVLLFSFLISWVTEVKLFCNESKHLVFFVYYFLFSLIVISFYLRVCCVVSRILLVIM